MLFSVIFVLPEGSKHICDCNRGHIIPVNRLQAGATAEVAAELCHAIRDRKTLEAVAFVERTGIDFGDRVRQVNGCQVPAGRERSPAHSSHIIVRENICRNVSCIQLIRAVDDHPLIFIVLEFSNQDVSNHSVVV